MKGGIATFKSFSLLKYIVKKISKGPKSAVNLTKGLYMQNVNICKFEGVLFSIDFF